jgi:hypothetical protein
MRYVDVSELKNDLPSGWEDDAVAALREVRDLTQQARDKGLDERVARSKAINERGALWGRLKSVLRKLSHDKCWYCESVEIRSDNAVDHYRPKNRIHGLKDHDGYWWLAFCWQNYRFSCTFCNSWRTTEEGTKGGKQDYFPILDPKTRAWRETDDVRIEVPLLLDPTVSLDASLIWFIEDGSAVASSAAEQSEVLKQRVDESIKYYHLHQESLKELRRKKWTEVRRKVVEAEEALDKTVTISLNFRDEVSRLVGELSRMTKKEAEYSSVVFCALRTLSSSYKKVPDMALRA